MPLYEYRCRKCGTHVEKIQKFADRPLRTCEKCGGELERLLSSPAIQFKGSGWYVTDYARKSSPDSAPSSSSDKPATPANAKSDGSAAAESKKPSEPSTAKSKK